MSAGANNDAVLAAFVNCIGAANVIADPSKNEHFRRGWRSGEGAALAVLFPLSLVQIWRVLQICVEQNCIIIMQAANTGLTEGSTPKGCDYDRPVVVINCLAVNHLHLINDAKQVLAFPGTTLHHLQKTLNKHGRAPHSVIGSSSLGATVIGGVANNSGGALVKRGPAYTELALFAQVDAHGELHLVNHLGIDLGDTAEDILHNLETGAYQQADIANSEKMASDREYIARIRDVDANTPSRFNADKRRLYEASGCAGKLAVFAVRLDTHAVPQKECTFYLGTNSVQALAQLRRDILTQFNVLPDVAEYMHKDCFDVAQKYGKDTCLSIRYLGTDALPKLFALKGRIDAYCRTSRLLPTHLTDRVMQFVSRFFPSQLPRRLLDFRRKYTHHLILKVSDNGIAEARDYLSHKWQENENCAYFECTENESQAAFMNRFAAAGAALRYQVMHRKSVGEVLALDIALRRNDNEWFEQLPDSIERNLVKKLYYGHFLCLVLHQDYILRADCDPAEVKKQLLMHTQQRGAKYPAEHNVGHLYQAEQDLVSFYQKLDPTNTFNPGIGLQSKLARNCVCC